MKYQVRRFSADFSASIVPLMSFSRIKAYTMQLRKRANSEQTINDKVEEGSLFRSKSTCTNDGADNDGVNLVAAGYRYFSSQITFRLLCLIALLLTYSAFAGAYRQASSNNPCDVMRDTLLEVNEPVERDNSFVPVLPKIIHQQWKDENIPSGKFSKWHKKWKDIYPEPEYQHMLWTDASGRELIEKHYPFFLQTYDSYQFNIQRADAMRYFILHQYGGVYADMDYEPLVNFWHYIPKDRVAFVESPFKYVEVVQNSFMSSPKGDPFWLNVFKTLEAQRFKPVFYSTGPSLVEESFRSSDQPWHMFPCETFYRISDSTNSSDRSPFLGFLKQQTIDKLYPMKYCGDFSDLRCHFGRHHCSASYIQDTGVLALLWNGH